MHCLSLILFSLLTAAAEREIPITNPDPVLPLPSGVPETSETSRVLGLVLELPIYSFYLGSPNIKGEAYVPNYIPRLGPQISWNGYGARMTFSLGLPAKERQRRGDTDQRNFLFNFYWKQYAVNLYYQYFKGFYVASPFTEISSSKPDRYTQLPEAAVSHYGVNVYLKSDFSRYGLDTAFDQSKLHRVDGEDWIYAPFYRRWSIDLGDVIIPGTAPDSMQSIPDVTGGTFDTVGLAYGYSKTWIWERYFASALGSIGPGVQYQRYEDSGNQFTKITLAGKFNGKLAAGVRGKDHIFGMQFLIDTLYSRIAGTEIYSTMATVEAYVNKSF